MIMLSNQSLLCGYSKRKLHSVDCRTWDHNNRMDHTAEMGEERLKISTAGVDAFPLGFPVLNCPSELQTAAEATCFIPPKSNAA